MRKGKRMKHTKQTMITMTMRARAPQQPRHARVDLTAVRLALELQLETIWREAQRAVLRKGMAGTRQETRKPMAENRARNFEMQEGAVPEVPWKSQRESFDSPPKFAGARFPCARSHAH